MKTTMNLKVRETVKQQMRERNISQTMLADKVAMSRVNLVRLLSGRSGQVPEGWQKVLDELELELIAVPKGADPSQFFGSPSDHES